VPLLWAAAALAWEGDHVTFVKPCAADIAALTGFVLQELALRDDTEARMVTQLARGAVVCWRRTHSSCPLQPARPRASITPRRP
jgi:hypothetical protein